MYIKQKKKKSVTGVIKFVLARKWTVVKEVSCKMGLVKTSSPFQLIQHFEMASLITKKRL